MTCTYDCNGEENPSAIKLVRLKENEIGKRTFL